MQVIVNDEPVTVSPHTHLADLITQLELPSQGIAAAVNQQVVNRQRWDDYALQANDSITLFSVVAGG
ncbi:sulfur carrier protein ThiS [Alteromonas gilva]|uniref:Sulfur carrier protein ThiS n=1 Tax=Alteromonas gilva TaxID=2987522 RepID=A0ABT5L4Q1_9ALTE|nr:sulfur carrier protein ThiS [Alteromonas gilva]MDC8832021.1 sulfur carrier protein ThiS [Alteromonas gilva]